MYFKRIQTMKNKLFLALALAGAVACDKDKPVTPNNTNDASAQIQNLLNNFDASKDIHEQVQNIANGIQADEAMKLFLLEGKTERYWQVVPFTKITVTGELERTYSWKAGGIDKGNSGTYEEEYYEGYKPLKFELNPAEDKEENDFLINPDKELIVYTKEGYVEFSSNKQCANAKEAIEYFIDEDTQADKNEKTKLLAKYANQELCVYSVGQYDLNLNIASNNPKKIEIKGDFGSNFQILTTKTGEKISSKGHKGKTSYSKFFTPRID